MTFKDLKGITYVEILSDQLASILHIYGKAGKQT